MIRITISVMALILSGCSPETKSENDIPYAQFVLSNSSIACRDGVQYLVYAEFNRLGVTPRYKKDGTLYQCSVKPATFEEVPLD